jgi:mitogen-activated protein kinase kinase
MDGGSLDKLVPTGVGIRDERILAWVTSCTVRGLKYLKDNLNIIHRGEFRQRKSNIDVKPTNILVNTKGDVKLCDFGVSGNLVASLAKTNIGCQSYMAPERIRGDNAGSIITYSVQSDIWSLGLSILEIAKGVYPYPPDTYNSVFAQLSAIVDGEPPHLPDGFSPVAQGFVRQWYSSPSCSILTKV